MWHAPHMMVGCWDGLWHCVCQCLPQYWSFLGGKLMVKRGPPVWKNIRMVVGKTVPFFDRQQGCAVQLLISWKKFRCHPRIDTYEFLGAKALRFGTMIGPYPNLLLLGSNGRAPIYKTYVHGLVLSHIFKFSELVHLPFLHDRHHLETTMHYNIYVYIYIYIIEICTFSPWKCCNHAIFCTSEVNGNGPVTSLRRWRGRRWSQTASATEQRGDVAVSPWKPMVWFPIILPSGKLIT